LLQRELDVFAAETAQSEDPVSPDRVEALNGLAKLIETRDSLSPKTRNWWVAFVFLGTLIAASVLLFVRVRETEIELDVAVTELSFSLARAQAPSGAMNLSALGVSGLQDIELPLSSGQASAVSLTPATSKRRSGTVTLSPLFLPADSRLTLRRSDVANQYQLWTTGINLRLQATAEGSVSIGMSNAPARTLDFAIPKTVLLRGGPKEVSIDLTFDSLPKSPLAPLLQVRDISLSRIDQFVDSNQSLVRRLSTITSGTLSFESLNGQELRLRPGEDLQFKQSQGEIRSLELGVGQIGLKFHGRVQGMAEGVGEGHRSIMPTYLEWLKARHGLSLLWAASLYLFGLVAGALRWWGVRL
jgi:hypothetical protein